MQQTPIKFGLVAIIILEIFSIFYLIRVYDNFVSNPDNYYKNILAKQAKEKQQVIDEY